MATHLNVSIVGLSQTGKSSLAGRFLNNSFAQDGYRPTDTCLLQDVVSTIVDGTVLSATVMDTPGRESDITSLPKWFHWSDAVIIVYSINLKHSFEVGKKYVQALHALSQESKKLIHTPIFLVGLKEDLDRHLKRLVSVDAGQQLATQHGFPFFECSAKTGVGINTLWSKVIGAALVAHNVVDDIVKKISAILPNFKAVSGGQQLAEPGRRLVKDGLLTRYIPGEDRKKDTYVAFFNDYFCICKPKYGNSGQITCLHTIPLSSAIILEGPSNPKKSMFFFRIHHVVRGKTYDFMVHSLSEKNDWLDSLEEHVNALKGTGGQITQTSLIEEFCLKNLNRLSKRSDRIFGVGLTDVVQKQLNKNSRDPQLDPSVISQGFDYLRQEAALKHRGIFQLTSLEKPLVRQLRNQWNTGVEPPFDGLPYDVAAELIVLYFKQLPLSVIPRDFTELMIKFYDLQDENKRIENLCTLLSALPPSNFAVLVDVLVYLGFACEEVDANGLSYERAGLVFSKLLMHLEPNQYRKCSSIISLMIQHIDKLMETHNMIVEQGSTVKAPSTHAAHNYNSSYLPMPKFLYALNHERLLTAVNKSKYKLLEVIKEMNARTTRNTEFEAAFQSMLITLNAIASYEPTFVKYFVDVSHINSFYLRILELNRILVETKPKANKANKFFNSTRDAMEADHIKGQLSQCLDLAFESLDRNCNWSREVRTAYFKIRKELERAHQLKLALGIQHEVDIDNTMAALEPVYADAAVRSFWDSNFGLEKFVVKVDLFIDALLRLNEETTLTDTDRQVVRHILDHHNTGQVNIYRFAIFVSGYGPIQNCLANVIKMSSEKWFYGFLSYPESVRMLEGQAPGTFLVRFSQSNPGNFSVDYVGNVASAASLGVGSPAKTGVPQTEMRTVKIHNSPGGFEVVRADLAAARSGPNSASNSAPTSAPTSAPNSGKFPESPPVSGNSKMNSAQGSFRMRTMTVLQSAGRKGSVGVGSPPAPASSLPLHLQRPPAYLANSPPNSMDRVGTVSTPPHSPPVSSSNAPSSPAPPLPTSPPPTSSSSLATPSMPPPPTPSYPPRLPPLEMPSAPLLFPSIDGVLDHLKDIITRPAAPNYFVLPYFHGCLEREAALAKLAGQNPGTYLARFGDIEDTLALHVMASSAPLADGDLDLANFQSDAKVETLSVERIGGSEQVRHLGVTYPTLEKFVASYKTPMRTPLAVVQEKTEEPAVIEDGTLEKIVEKLYNGTEIGVAQVFLLTYRAFATPVAVLNILRERVHYHREHNQDRVYRLRMGNFVKTWLTEYSWDIKDEKDFFKLCGKFAFDLASDQATSAIGQQLFTLLQKNQDAAAHGTSSSPSSLGVPALPNLKPLRADRANLNPANQASHSRISSDGGSVDDASYGERYGDDDDTVGSGSPSSSGASSPSPGGTVLSNSAPGGPRRENSGPLTNSPRSESPRVSMSMSTDRVGSPSSATLRSTVSSNSLRLHDMNATAATRSVLEIPVVELAEQLTLIEAEVFVAIPCYEFLQQGWLKTDKETRSPNLLRMVRFSTRLSRWVVSEVLADERPQKRAKVIEYFVQLCHELLKLRNFNDIMAVLAALSGSAIGRLKKTWDAFPRAKKKELDELHSLMNTDSNWNKYRTTLMNAPPPKIPYLGLVLTDLVFIEDGNHDRLPSGHINWTKCELIAECLKQVQLCQQSPYGLAPNEALIDNYVLEYAKTMTEREAYERSLVVEPRKAKKT